MTKTYYLYGLIATICLIECRPVGAESRQSIQDVNVVNTPTVTVAGTPTVAVEGIAVKTVKIFDQSNFSLSKPIDVTAFKQIRIAAWCGTQGQSLTVDLYTLLDTNNVFQPAALGPALSVSCGTGVSATYDVPGEAVVIKLSGKGRVVVFGRAN